MSLLDEAREAQNGIRGPECTFKLIRLEHPEMIDDLDELLVAVREKKVYATTAVKTLRAHGITIKDKTLNRHARRECSCPS